MGPVPHDWLGGSAVLVMVSSKYSRQYRFSSIFLVFLLVWPGLAEERLNGKEMCLRCLTKD